MKLSKLKNQKENNQKINKHQWNKIVIVKVEDVETNQTIETVSHQ